MVLLNSPIRDQDKVMPSFELMNIDGTVLKSRELVGKSGTLIMFICNHCPYVKAIIDKIVETTNELENLMVKDESNGQNHHISIKEQWKTTQNLRGPTAPGHDMFHSSVT